MLDSNDQKSTMRHKIRCFALKLNSIKDSLNLNMEENERDTYFFVELNCFLINLYISDPENDEAFILPKKFYSFYQKNTVAMINGDILEGMYCESGELLRTFIKLSKAHENFVFFNHFLPFIIKFLKPNWLLNIHILTFELLESLLVHGHSSKIYRENKELTEILETSSGNLQIQRLKNNILYMICNRSLF